MVTKPKLKEGIVVINLRLQTEVLLMKNLHNFFNKEDFPWVKLLWSRYYNNGQVPGHTLKGGFWWRNNLKLLNSYKGLAQAQAGSGDSILFWQDLWNRKVLKLCYPQLYSFTNKENISLASVLVQENPEDLFHLPLPEEACARCCEVNILLQSLQAKNGQDRWTYIWGNGHYSSVRAYKHLIGNQPVHPVYIWLWKSACQPKHKVFFWLLLKNKLNTRGLLRRKHKVIDLKVADWLGLEPAGFGLKGLNDCFEPKPNLSERKTHVQACSCT
jgi:hypothetical protein